VGIAPPSLLQLVRERYLREVRSPALLIEAGAFGDAMNTRIGDFAIVAHFTPYLILYLKVLNTLLYSLNYL
jgi:hypothetical protein